MLAGIGAGGTVMWGAVAANGSAASAGEFDASAAADAPGTYTIVWRRPFAAPPLLLVSAGTFAICHAQDSTKWQVTVVCLAPGWELSADGHVVSLNADGRGFRDRARSRSWLCCSSEPCRGVRAASRRCTSI